MTKDLFFLSKISASMLGKLTALKEASILSQSLYTGHAPNAIQISKDKTVYQMANIAQWTMTLTLIKLKLRMEKMLLWRIFVNFVSTKLHLRKALTQNSSYMLNKFTSYVGVELPIPVIKNP